MSYVRRIPVDLQASEEPTVYAQWPGEAGTVQTIRMMRSMANEGAMHPWVRDRAAQVTAHCGRDQACQCRALYGYVKNVMPYVRDPADLEALHHPASWVERRLRSGKPVYGDCDDASLYLAALLKAIGHKPAFQVMGQGDRLHHIAVRCHDILLDTTVEPGRQYPQPRRTLLVPV